MLTAEFDIKIAQQVWKEEGKKEGREEGKEEGKKEEKVKTAQNLIKMGFNREQISKATELDTATVEKLYNGLHL